MCLLLVTTNKDSLLGPLTESVVSLISSSRPPHTCIHTLCLLVGSLFMFVLSYTLYLLSFVSLCHYLCIMYENCIHKSRIAIYTFMFVCTLIPREGVKESIKFYKFYNTSDTLALPSCSSAPSPLSTLLLELNSPSLYAERRPI